ncbi:MAG: terminase small subunit [Rhodospirillales bacterium]|nr:terminase small subunit [Rhodospirillales bacterium]
MASFAHGAPSPTGGPWRAGRPGRKLKPRQAAFCKHFVATGNAAEAARRAGYSARAARVQGHRLLKKPPIEARIREMRAAIAGAFDPAAILDRFETLYRMAERQGAYLAAARLVAFPGRAAGIVSRRCMAEHLLHGAGDGRK